MLAQAQVSPIATVAVSDVIPAPVQTTPLHIGDTTLDAELAALVTIQRTVRQAEPVVLAQADVHEPGALNDEELSEIRAGEFQLNLDNFDVVIQDNQAGQFKVDIAQNAFRGAQGVFTTLQAVNSAVDLTVIVNIYLGPPQ
ncbi:MAG: hypothetical protein HY352_04865 [Candidatus Omnitrophica bacterium]|nr:hypothetical protein [Candidatus Omnitrophota bacterium]